MSQDHRAFLTSSTTALRSRLEIVVQTVVESTWSELGGVLAARQPTARIVEQALGLLDQLDVVLEEARDRQVWTGRYRVMMPLHLRADLVRMVGMVATDLRNELRELLSLAAAGPSHDRRALLEELYVLLDGGRRTDPPQSGGLKAFLAHAERYGLAPSPSQLLSPEEREHFVAIVRRVILEIQEEQRAMLVAGPAVSALREQVAHLRQVWTLTDDLLFEILRARKRNLVDEAFVRAVTQTTWTLEPVLAEGSPSPVIDLSLATSGPLTRSSPSPPSRRRPPGGETNDAEDDSDDITHPSLPPRAPA